jgi:hypothetical protein
MDPNLNPPDPNLSPPYLVHLAYLACGVLIIFYAWDRFSTPASNRSSGSNLTFESEAGFPPHWSRASLAHANRNFHHSQAQ